MKLRMHNLIVGHYHPVKKYTDDMLIDQGIRLHRGFGEHVHYSTLDALIERFMAVGLGHKFVYTTQSRDVVDAFISHALETNNDNMQVIRIEERDGKLFPVVFDLDDMAVVLDQGLDIR